MFEKKQYIFSESMGVCLVEDITRLALKRGEPISYYVLRSVYQKDKTAYIPVEHHSVELRDLICAEEAWKLHDEWEQAHPKVEGEETEAKEYGTDEIELLDWQNRLLMADTLPKEKRDLLYRRGEVEFVCKQSKL